MYFFLPALRRRASFFLSFEDIIWSKTAILLSFRYPPPWAINLRVLGGLGFLEMFIFIGILGLGLIYAWRKGALEWE